MTETSKQVFSSLKPFVGSRKMIQLNRQTPCEPLANGFLLDISREWLLLWQFHDFFPDGLSFLRISGITGHRCGKYEEFWTDMLRSEGLIKEMPEIEVDMRSAKTILRDLQKTNQNITVESEDPRHNEQDYYLGRVTKIKKTQIEFACFDGLGKWDKNTTSIEFDDITRIQFNTAYETTFSRYVESDCPFPVQFAAE